MLQPPERNHPRRSLKPRNKVDASKLKKVHASQSRMNSPGWRGLARAPPAPGPQQTQCPAFSWGAETRNSQEGCPGPEHCLHTPLRGFIFSSSSKAPRLSPSSYCSLACTRESVSCEPSLRKGSQPASLWAAGCLAPPLLARPRVSTQPRGFLKLRGAAGVRCMNTGREANLVRFSIQLRKS